VWSATRSCENRPRPEPVDPAQDRGEQHMAVENSVAASENKAKAHPAYRAYKYLERIDDLCDEFTKMIEKFEGRMMDDGRM
jgi:hypothetical protein